MDEQTILKLATKYSNEMKLIIHPDVEEYLHLLGICSICPPTPVWVTDRSVFRFDYYSKEIDGTIVQKYHGWKEELASIRRRLCHGFVLGCKGKRGYGHDGEIHVWIDPICPLEKVLILLAHEVGHYHGEPCPDEWAEEQRADLFSLVTILAFRFLQQIEQTRKKNGSSSP